MANRADATLFVLARAASDHRSVGLAYGL